MKTTMLAQAAALFAGLAAATGLIVGAPAPQAKSRVYTIVPTESNFTVFVGKTGLFSSLAHDHNITVKSFVGRVIVPAAGVEQSTLEMEADAKSLALLDHESEKDRAEITAAMHNEVLESAKHPKIAFKSASITNVKPVGGNQTFTLNGDLTLHGVTRRIAIPVTVTVTPQQMKASGQYTLKQSDFGIKPYSAALGSVKVKNEVVINFSIVAK